MARLSAEEAANALPNDVLDQIDAIRDSASVPPSSPELQARESAQ